MSVPRDVDHAQASVVHDCLVRLLNLDPSQVRAGAFSVGYQPNSSDVTVTWDGWATITAEQWDQITRDAHLDP